MRQVVHRVELSSNISDTWKYIPEISGKPAAHGR